MNMIALCAVATLVGSDVLGETQVERPASPELIEGARVMPNDTDVADKWSAYEIAELEARRKASKRAYLEFLREPTLNCGLYVLPKGGEDKQNPHEQDEVYYILSGEATLKVDGKDRAVKPGSVVFVKRGIEHRFHSIEKELHVLVFFSAGKAEN